MSPLPPPPPPLPPSPQPGKWLELAFNNSLDIYSCDTQMSLGISEMSHLSIVTLPAAIQHHLCRLVMVPVRVESVCKLFSSNSFLL